MRKPKKQNLQCPFCAAKSTRGTGLSAHIRARHGKQYRNWNRNPNRLVEAAEAAATPKAEPEKNQRVRHMPSTPLVEARPNLVAPQETQSPAAKPQLGEPNGNEALSLLQSVQDQLAARKDSIESELARVEALKSEHESVIRQLAAIDLAMSAFQRS